MQTWTKIDMKTTLLYALESSCKEMNLLLQGAESIQSFTKEKEELIAKICEDFEELEKRKCSSVSKNIESRNW